MKADTGDPDFLQGMHDLLGLDEHQVEKLLPQLDVDALMDLADAIAKEDKQRAKTIVSQTETEKHTDEEVNRLFRGDGLDEPKRDQKANKKKLTNTNHFTIGDDVQVTLTDEDGKEYTDTGTVSIPDAPGDTVQVKIEGKPVMVHKDNVQKLDERVLGMVGLPNLQRMQQLAGIPAETPAMEPAEVEIVSGPQQEDDSAVSSDPVDQAMAALDALEAALPNVRLCDLKDIRQRLMQIQASMNESRLPQGRARKL